MAISYTCDRRNGVVKSEITDCQGDAIIKILKALNIQKGEVPLYINCDGEDWCLGYYEDVNIPRNLSVAIMKNSFSGKAKCHHQDSFDIKEGKKYAKSRMMKKYNHSKDRAIRRFYNQMQKDTERIEALISKNEKN